MQIILDNALHLLGFICKCDPYHGEVDTQLLLHVKGVVTQNEAVTTRSPEIEVFLLLLSFFGSSSELLIIVGSSISPRYGQMMVTKH